MKHLSMIIFLILVWCGLSDSFDYANVIGAAIVAGFCSWLFAMPGSQMVGKMNIWHLPWLIIFILYELVVSSLQVAWEVLSPKGYSKPKVLAVPLKCRGVLAETVLGNLVSLTPGTLCIDIDQERVMLVHAMFAKDPQQVVHFIQNKLEPKVMKVFENE